MSKILIEPIRFSDIKLELLDQRLLPFKEKYVDIARLKDTADAISDMVVRGAPAIGITAAYGYYQGIKEGLPEERVFNILYKTRPTAVNLLNSLERMRKVYCIYRDKTPEILMKMLFKEIKNVFDDERSSEFKMAEYGNSLIKEGYNVLTHCNTGALATTGWGTALGVIREAKYSGKRVFVWVDETRPRLQGAKLTVWELEKEQIPYKLISDTASSFVMKNKKIDIIFVGADRIALNGDTANKIGTYQVAIAAKYHKIPFYVVAPMSTVDKNALTGNDLPIEERDKEEVLKAGDCEITLSNTTVFNPAFDITPSELISGIITDKGIILPPFKELKEKVNNG